MSSKQRAGKKLTSLEKMYLLDENAFNKWKEENDDKKQLSILDRNMKIIMNRKDLSVARKWILYQNFLARYANFKRFIREQKKNGNSNISNDNNNNNKSNNEQKNTLKRNRANQTEEVAKADVKTNTDGNIVGNDEVFVLNNSDDVDDDMHMKTAQDVMNTIKNDPSMLQNVDLSELYDEENSDDRTLETSYVQMERLPQLTAQEQTELDELHRKYDNFLIAENTINGHLSKTSKTIQNAYRNLNPVSRIKNIQVDGEDHEIDLNKTKIDDDDILIAEDTSGGQITIKTSDLSNDDLYSIHGYLAEKHNQIESYIDEEMGESNKTPFETVVLKDGTTIVKFKNDIVKADGAILDYIEDYLNSGYAASNVTLRQILSWAKQHVSGDKYLSKLPLSKNRKTPTSVSTSYGPGSSSTPIIHKEKKTISGRVNKLSQEHTPSKTVTSYYKQTKTAKTVPNETPKITGKKDSFNRKRRASEQEGSANKLTKWATLYS